MNQDQAPAQPAAQSTNKQQVIDALKKANNVLITVSQSPNVDQLSACIGLALTLNKLNKHATAIFSGTVPSTIEFLQPEKLLESNTDSLRDFIISLDRDKADKLRYKIEDNVVRIFITPYRTSLSQNDLEFSQGDFNVDAVVAMGVDQREHLDLAIMQQGRILHDAVVIGISAGNSPSSVGAINWHEPAASSICELVVGMSDAMQPGLLDAQIATALLTGIVSETDRFRNERTSAKVMTISAQLMAAGANQQLVAQQLEATPVAPAQPQLTEMPVAQPESLASFDVPQEGESGPKEAAVSLHVDPNAHAPAVQLPGELTEDDIKKIKIDEEGILHDDTGQDQIINRPHKVIQPLAEQNKESTSSYISSPPERGGTLTAETFDNPMSELPNPSVQPPTQTPILSHDSPMVDAQEAVVDEAAGPGLPDSTASAQVVTPASNPPQPSAESNTTPAESQSQPPQSNGGIDAESARRAVLDAVASGPTILPPKPIAALNAMPLDLSAPAPSQTPQAAMAPPPLPPPIAPITQNDPSITLPQPQNLGQPMQNEAPQQGNTPFNLPPPQQ